MRKLGVLLLVFQMVSSPLFAAVVDNLELVPSSKLYFSGETVDAILYGSAVSDESLSALRLDRFNRFSFEVVRLTSKGEEFVAQKEVSLSDSADNVSYGKSALAYALDITKGEPLEAGTYLLKFVASTPGEEPYVLTTNFKVHSTTVVQAAKLI